MSERNQPNFTHENAEPRVADSASPETLVRDLAERRQAVQVRLVEVQSRPGFKLDAIEMMQKRREERELQAELDALDHEWASYGGNALDEAQAAVDALNFKSTAEDHVRAKTALRDARNAVYGTIEHPLRRDSEQEDAAAELAGEMPVPTSAPEDEAAGVADGAVAASEDEPVQPARNPLYDKELINEADEFIAKVKAKNGIADEDNAPELHEGKNELDDDTARKEAVAQAVADKDRVLGEFDEIIARNTDATPESTADSTKNEDTSDEGTVEAGDTDEPAPVDTSEQNEPEEAEIAKKTRLRDWLNPTYLYTRFETWRHKRREELAELTDEERKSRSRRNKALAVGVGIVALAGAALLVKHGLDSSALTDGGSPDLGTGAGDPGNGPEIDPNDYPPLEGVETGSGDVTPSPEVFSDSAYTVDRGEGWFQTFNELGLRDQTAQWNLLHNHELMSQLQQMGLAYPDVNLGGWGINMTPDGKMPQAALELIRDYAVQSGYDLAA